MHIGIIKKIAFYLVFSSRRQHFFEQDNFCFRCPGQAFISHRDMVLLTESDSRQLAQSEHEFIIAGDTEIRAEFPQFLEGRHLVQRTAMCERHLLAQSADDIADRIVFQLDKIAGTIDQIDAWIDQSQTCIFSCKREAARQTAWVRKIIIGTNERHPFPGHSLKALIPGVIDAAIRLGDKIGNLVDKLINNKLRAIGRTAVNDNNFGPIGLFKYAGQTFL